MSSSIHGFRVAVEASRFASRRACRSYSTTKTSTCSTPASSSRSLSPLRYHIFSEPLPYLIGLKLQHEIINRRLDLKKRGTETDDIILFLEHTPTYTTGRRDNSPNPDTLHPEEKKVQNVGAEFHITKRGGQVTYHGPGQLVGYPIMDLNRMEVSTRCYVDWLQALLAGWCRDQGLDVLAPHPDGHVGIFSTPTEKVASIGIHLQHRITSHGFAMNLTQEPIRWFDLVTACGLTDVRATSIHDMLTTLKQTNGVDGEEMPTVRRTAEMLVPGFGEVYKRDIRDLKDGGEGELVELCERAEEEAAQLNRRNGGWPTEPDLTRRLL